MSSSVKAQIDRLNSEAFEFAQRGLLVEARTVAAQALGLGTSLSTGDRISVAYTHNILGSVASKMGDYSSAQQHFTQGIRLWQEVADNLTDHEDVSLGLILLMHLAVLNDRIGDRSGARSVWDAILPMMTQYGTFLPSSGRIAIYLNLGQHYGGGRDYSSAEENFRIAVDLGRALRASEPQHSSSGSISLVQALHALAWVCRVTARYPAAEAHLIEALGILRVVTGLTGDPAIVTQTALLLDSIGVLQHEMGKLQAARQHLAGALRLRRILLPDTHPLVAKTLFSLGEVDYAVGDEYSAVRRMTDAAIIDDGMISRLMGFTSERQRLPVLWQYMWRLHAFLSIVLQQPAPSGPVVEEGINLLLRRKALTAEVFAIHRDVTAGASPEQSPVTDLDARLQGIDWRTIAKALPDNAVLIEFVRVYTYDFTAVVANGERRFKPPRYLAFVLQGGAQEEPAKIDLGPAYAIEEMIHTFRASIAMMARPQAWKRLSHGDQAKMANAGALLREAVFDPLANRIPPSAHLMLAPDGDLHLLPFAALPTGANECLIDRYLITYLSSARDVLRFGKKCDAATAPVVLADADFELGIDFAARVWRKLTHQVRPYERLRGARREGKAVARLLAVEPWLGKQVLEGRLKAVRSPSVLHIATHGRFTRSTEVDFNEYLENRGGTGAEPMDGPITQNPLLRSELALAGANATPRQTRLPLAEDGVLNAVDVSAMNLANTQLVVLSACETALGGIHLGEGVFGLRRAFALAGARTLVMSLWKVPDRVTCELMTEFYSQLRSDTPRAIALRNAQRVIKRRFRQPYLWGSFVLEGEPGRLGASSEPVL